MKRQRVINRLGLIIITVLMFTSCGPTAESVIGTSDVLNIDMDTSKHSSISEQPPEIKKPEELILENQASQTLIYRVNSRYMSDGANQTLINESSMVYPFLYEGAVMLPMTSIANRLGFETRWEGSSNALSIMTPSGKFVWQNQQSYYYLKGGRINFRQPVQIFDDFAYVDVRDMADILACVYVEENDYIIINPIESKDDIASINLPLLEDEKYTILDGDPSFNSGVGFYNHHLIAHALGSVERTAYTNTYEAFEKSYEQGFRIFEVDLISTLDGELVAKHDWSNHWYKTFKQKIPNGYVKGEEETILNYEAFKGLKVLGKLRPMAYVDIEDLMHANSDVFIIIDAKDDDYFELYRKLLEETDDDVIDRVVPQVYNFEMLKSLEALEVFDHFILSLYKSTMTDVQVVAGVKENDVKAVVMSEERYNPNLVKKLRAMGVYVYVHTVNSPEKAMAYFEEGVFGVYTDYLGVKTFDW